MKAFRIVLLAWLVALPAVHAQAQSDEDSYRDARRALNRQQFDGAVAGFRALRGAYPGSRYVGDSFYWEAFGLERQGSLEEAVRVLDTLAREHPDASRIGDARALRVQICSELARRGNGECGAADVWASVGDPDDEAMKSAALNALINMPPERAVALATKVLENREQPVAVRKQALFIIADKANGAGDSTATRDTLLKTALDETDNFEVRKQAVFWLSQVPGDATLDVLVRVLNGSADPELKNQAIFAISQQGGPRALEILKSLAADRDAGVEARKKALFWAAQSGLPSAELTAIYRAAAEPELREHLIFLMAENQGVDSLIEIARSDPDTEMRKKAIFWLGQSRDPRAEQLLVELLEP